MKVTAILLKPLDGKPEGSEAEFDQGDFETLEKLGAVRRKASAAPAPGSKPATKKNA